MAAFVVVAAANREKKEAQQQQQQQQQLSDAGSPGNLIDINSPPRAGSAGSADGAGGAQSSSSPGDEPLPQANPANQKVFERFDADQSGVLEISEVKEALKILLGVEISPDKFNAAMKKFDTDGSGHLDVLEFDQLVADLKNRRKSYVDPPVVPHKGSILGKDRKLPFQDEVLGIYHMKIVAFFVALCIIGNFFVNILEKQIDPDTNEGKMKHKSLWVAADTFFNIVFVIELWANMWSFGGPVKAFWKDGWNVFDTLIVTVGVLTMVNVLGPPLDKLKLMRAFRVFRLFKRVESLNKIIVALIKSVPGVINAFVVMLVFFCIYAILAVELFRDFGDGGVYFTYDSLSGQNITNNAMSTRGYTLGIEYYGTFMRALYTLFQVMTGESWSEAVARPLLFGLYSGDAVVVGIFFVSFIILTQIVLINVVVAVLLEKFVADEESDDGEDAALESRLAMLDNKEASGDMSNKLDRIIRDLSNFATLERSVTQLQAKMADMDAVARSVSDLTAEMRCLREERAEIFL